MSRLTSQDIWISLHLDSTTKAVLVVLAERKEMSLAELVSSLLRDSLFDILTERIGPMSEQGKPNGDVTGN